jgi:seryl-tRNA synthetase
MLDLKRIRQEADAVRAALSKRGDPELGGRVDRVLELDGERRRLIQRSEDLKARRNEASKEIGERKKRGEDASELIAEMREVADEISGYDERLGAVESEIESVLLRLPNTPRSDVPAGDESANETVRSWGEPLEPADWRKPHWDLGESLGVIDLERAARIAGSGFPLFIGVGARLERALIAFMLDLHLDRHGYREVYPPFLVTTDTMTATGQLPALASDAYKLEGEEMWLIPTAEVPVTNLHAGEILEPEEMPKRYVSWTACFRREAGAAGRETRGITRVHQFDKVELVRLERPAESDEALEEMTGHAEAVLQALELPYRVIRLAAGDIARQSAATYDIEAWSAGAERWLEVSSCSNCTDYQARRADVRFRPEPGAKPEFVHTLNGSGLSLPRTVIALLEHYQRPDGSVELPAALHPYMKTKRIEPV